VQILFALLCGYLPFEDANTARLYEKIMGGEYELPEFLSPESKDLIQKLLNTDPRKRYNAEQVRRHPWYCRIKVPTDPLFPPGDAESPVVPGPQASGKKVKRTISGQTVDDETEIDQSVLQNMVLLGYHPQQVQESIASNRHDHFAATYHLLVMKKNMTNKTTASSSTSSSSGATSKPSGAPTKPQPPPVPRIPTSSHGSSTGSQVPSAPVSQSHHPQPPQTAKPVYVAQRPQTQHAGRETQGSAGTTAAVAAANQHQNQAFSSSGAPASARVATSSPPPAPTRGATVAAGTAPVSTAGGSARVQSAGTVRPSAGGAPTAAAYAGVNTARPGTSYQGTKGDGSAGVSQHPQQQAWNDTASTQAQAHAQQVAALGGTLGVSNGVNGGANVNAYMQHYQAQQAALYAANAGAAAQAYYRPPSSSPQSSRGASSQQPQQPSSQQQKPPSSISQPPTSRPGTSSGPQPQSVQVKAPSASQPPYPRAPSGGSGGGGGRGGRAGAKVKSASGGGGGGQVPTVPQQAFFSGNPMESIATPSYSQHPASSPHRGSTNPSQSPRSSTAAPSPHRGNPSVAIGPATGRPMTSRITGSTGGVSHRLYFPPSERAAHDLALSLANAASRPGTSSGTHPHTSSRPGSSHGLHLTGASTSSSTGGSVSRPGTSSSSRRPPSGQRSHPRSNVGGYKTERERARERERERERELELDAGLDELEWTGEGSSTARQPASSPTGASTASSFNTQLSAMSFKPQRAILEELQRVLHSNGLQFTILPPSGSSASGAAANPLSPLGKHGFVPANLAAGGVSAASASLAPISISSLKPLPRGLDGLDGSSSSSQNQVLEVRAGSNRFQFHVAPIAAGSAGMAKALAADFDGDASSSAGHGAGYAVRVKRVLGDAASFRDICAKLLPQLKL
jgi:hypothetical protein